MKNDLYIKLAFEGIKKNRQLYLPYILTCIGMVFMHFIMKNLANSKLLEESMIGFSTTSVMMSFGAGVIAVFSMIFLFYTNSFLMKRRKKEFGLYNILGMGKRHIALILFYENTVVATISLVLGIIFGIVLSKLSELFMCYFLKLEANYNFDISLVAVIDTVKVFVVIFILLLLYSLTQIHLSKPLSLLRSEQVGEKAPKANWVGAILGFIILAIAYYIAVSIKNPILALEYFFIAVIMVIIATYLLFIAGSVFVCKILQRKKNFYYQTNHFFAVSSLTYRMKRNGAGLASICILATMVLVTLSSTTCLYFGTQSTIKKRFPNDIGVHLYFDEESYASLEESNISSYKAEIEECASAYTLKQINTREFFYHEAYGLLKDHQFSVTVGFNTMDYSNTRIIYIVSLEDYNACAGTDYVLAEDEILLYSPNEAYDGDTLTICHTNIRKTYRVQSQLDSFVEDGSNMTDIISTIYIVMPDVNNQLFDLTSQDEQGQWSGFNHSWFYGFDVNIPSDQRCELGNYLKDHLVLNYGFTVDCRELSKNSYYADYGGFFFLGIMLSIVFIVATVLIIYYKQITEGYEDYSKFELMQKVGMSKEHIKQSVNTQMRLVFFLPLIMAMLHLCFAFPMIKKLLLLFGLDNFTLFLTTSSISVLIFAVAYAIVYRITANEYYHIVSSSSDIYQL